MIRLLIVDDHAIVRKGLKQIFAIVPDIVVAGEASNAAEAFEMLRQTTVDMILLDLTMPGISGEDLIASLTTHFPKTPILVLSMHNEPQIIHRALKAGASGYLNKDNEPEVLIAAIQKVASGGRYIDSQLAEQLAFQNTPGLRFSEREYQVLRLIAKGLSGNDVAEALNISSKTVSTHKANLMKKMGFTSTAELVRYAIENGLVQ